MPLEKNSPCEGCAHSQQKRHTYITLTKVERYLLCLSLILFQCPSYAQEPIELNIMTQKLVKPLPFDQPFDLIIKNEDLAKSQNIRLEVTPLNKKQDDRYFKDRYINNKRIPGRPSTDKKEITFYNVRPLRPNRTYKFEIKFDLKYADLPTGMVNNAIQKILIENLNIVAKAGTHEEAEKALAETKNELEDYLRQYLVENNITPFDVNVTVFPFSEALGTFSAKYITTLIKKKETENKILVLLSTLKNTIKEISPTNSVANLYEKALLKEMEKWSDTTRMTILNDLHNLQQINSIPISDEDSTKIVPLIHFLLVDAQSLDEHSKALTTLINTPHTFNLADIFKDNSLSFEVTAKADISSENSPYISYESGIGGRPFKYYSNFVRFGALNLTILPNSKTHLCGNFNWRAIVLKSISVQAGLARPLIGDLDNRMEHSANSRSIMLGIGVKLGYFRVNYSGIFYKVKDINPTVNSSILKWVSYPNISLSISLKAIAGEIDKLLTN